MLRPFPILLLTLALSACVKVAKNVKAQSPLPTLAGSEWGPEGENKDDQFVAFKMDGEVIGHGGCNRFFGSYDQDGDMLTFGPLASTRMACPNLDAEQAFMSALQAARQIEATHMQLILKGEDGTPVLTLRRRDWD